MSSQILSQSDFTSKADLPSNIKESRFNASAMIVQEKFLPFVLCKETYEEFIDQWNDGGESYLDQKYQDLLPYVKNYLIFKTYQRLVTLGNFINTVSGQRVIQTDIDREVTSAEKAIIVKQADEDADFYRDDLLNYLEDNKDVFPLWKKSKCFCDRYSKGISNLRFSDNKRRYKAIKNT